MNEKPVRNNDSTCVGDWTTQNLMNTTRALYCSIYQAECFSTRDIRNYELCTVELQKRGYELQIHESLSITKAEKKK